MKKIDFSYTGGFPFEQKTLDEMQSAYVDILASFVGFMGIPDVGSHILFGCTAIGGNITPGMMYIDGDLCSFSGAVGNSTTKIKKLTTVVNAPFENGNNNPVYISTTAVVDGSGTALSDFTRKNLSLVYDGNYVHTDQNFTLALLEKLNTIAAGAEVNVQSDWEVVNPLSDAFIKNKPPFLKELRKGTVLFGNIAGEDIRTVSFPPIDTANYIVIGSMVSMSPGWVNDNDQIFLVREKTTSSFKVIMREFGSPNQTLNFDYLLIAL